MLPARRFNGQYGLTDFFNDFFDNRQLEKIGVTSPAINVKENDKGYKIESAEKDKIPSNYVKLENEDDLKKMRLLIEYLEDHDDVQEIYHNWESPDEE